MLLPRAFKGVAADQERVDDETSAPGIHGESSIGCFEGNSTFAPITQ
jgi:hypothetical protein